jgi:hypothetical protein
MYYDTDGSIRGVSFRTDETLEQYSKIEIDEETARSFLRGELSPSDWYIGWNEAGCLAMISTTINHGPPGLRRAVEDRSVSGPSLGVVNHANGLLTLSGAFDRIWLTDDPFIAITEADDPLALCALLTPRAEMEISIEYALGIRNKTHDIYTSPTTIPITIKR